LQVFMENGKKFITLFKPAFQLPPQVAEEPFTEKISLVNLIYAGDV